MFVELTRVIGCEKRIYNTRTINEVFVDDDGFSTLYLQDGLVCRVFEDYEYIRRILINDVTNANP